MSGSPLGDVIELDLPRDRLGIPPRVADFLRQLGGPSLLRVRGERGGRCRVVSALLHGNEPSGARAVHRWLRSGERPATDVFVLIGAVEAALEPPGFAHRFLPGHRDLNRCWLAPFEGREGAIAESALAVLARTDAESLIDLHNNTGRNPAYGVGPRRGPVELELVSLFAERFVHSPLELRTLVEATQERFPSVTIECGRAGDPQADDVAHEGLLRYVALESLESLSGRSAKVEIFSDPIRVTVAPGVSLGFGSAPMAECAFTVDAGIDRHNFACLEVGASIGWLAPGCAWPLRAHGPGGIDLSPQLFAARQGHLETRRPMIPIMMTTDRAAALADCLFYAVRCDSD